MCWVSQLGRAIKKVNETDEPVQKVRAGHEGKESEDGCRLDRPAE